MELSAQDRVHLKMWVEVIRHSADGLQNKDTLDVLAGLRETLEITEITRMWVITRIYPGWDMATAVMRVAPSETAGDMYKAEEPISLPHNYRGPMPLIADTGAQ